MKNKIIFILFTVIVNVKHSRIQGFHGIGNNPRLHTVSCDH